MCVKVKVFDSRLFYCAFKIPVWPTLEMNVWFTEKFGNGIFLDEQDAWNHYSVGLCFSHVTWMQAFLGLRRKWTFDRLYINRFLKSWESMLLKANTHTLWFITPPQLIRPLFIGLASCRVELCLGVSWPLRSAAEWRAVSYPRSGFWETSSRI